MQRLIAWIRFFNADGVEDIEEIEIDVKGVIPVNERQCVCRALKIAGTDISIVDNTGHGRAEKAIIQPYKSRMRNRRKPEVPDMYFDLGELNDDYYYLILAACSLGLNDVYVIIDDVKYIILNKGDRFLHNQGLYTWCVIQRVNHVDGDYYDDIDDAAV